jgi:Predicted membrane protein (DUF2232)
MVQFWLQIGLVGLGAGACSAMLFASVLSGSILSIGLFYLAPLPILIVAIGWSHWGALAGAISAALALAVAFGGFLFFAFLFSVGLPAWWLGYLALLARPATPEGELEWYPPGRLVVWAAILGALVVLAALSQFGSDEASIRATLHGAFETMFRKQMHITADEPLTFPGIDAPQRLIDVLVTVLPPAAAVLSTVTQLINLWLAGRIVRISGRLRRPWPDLSAMRFPPATPVVFAVAFAGSFMPGLVGIAAALPAASLLLAYAVLGFAVLHGITRHLQSRAIVLVGIYTAVAIFGWPVLLMTLLGLVDTALDLRGRIAAMRGPPAPLA